MDPGNNGMLDNLASVRGITKTQNYNHFYNHQQSTTTRIFVLVSANYCGKRIESAYCLIPIFLPLEMLLVAHYQKLSFWKKVSFLTSVKALEVGVITSFKKSSFILYLSTRIDGFESYCADNKRS